VSLKKSLLKAQKGNAIITGVVALTLLTISILMLTQGYLSTLKFKSRVQTKASLTSVKDGIFNAFTLATLYQNGTNLNGALQNQINIPQAGTLRSYDTGQASDLLARLANNSLEKSVKTLCDGGNQIPTAATSPAEFIFCFSTVTGNDRVIDNSLNSFFGSDAFGRMKVVLKRRSATHRQFISELPLLNQFRINLNPVANFQADMTYTFVWGKKNEPNSIFLNSGHVLRDLR
jgi:hypothetical protein